MHSTEKKQKKAPSTSKTVKKIIRKETIIPEESVTLKAEEHQVRYLKVQPRYRHSSQHISIVPELRLNGRWFEKVGFDMACHASITVMDGLLIIRSKKEVK